MTMIESFVKERNEALFSLDRRKIEAYLVKYGEGETAKAPDMLFWASVYKAKAQVASRAVADAIFRKNNPTVREYCEKWLKMKSATVRPNTLEGYRKAMEKHIIEPIGDRYIDEITADDLKMLMVPVSKMSKGLYGTVNMLLKCVFYSAIESDVIRDNPAACINPRGGKSKKEKVALTDKQIATLLDTIKDLPPHLFVMLGLYAGLRREEILGLQWDCVHIDEEIPYISVRRAWRSVKNRPEVTTLLKTPAARRDIPIPQLLVDCLKAEKEKSSSDYVISDSNGEPLSYSQFSRVWHYITVRTVKERKIYRYINGEKIHHTISPKLGERCRTDKSIYYTLDFDVTPHLLRHTYITNLIHEGVDPKTVQYLAGHENSKVTMDSKGKTGRHPAESLENTGEKAKILLEYGLKAARRAPQFSKR